jgi:hypothetical protein
MCFIKFVIGFMEIVIFNIFIIQILYFIKYFMINFYDDDKFILL